MLSYTKRNRKIFHLLESTIHDFCKVLECSYSCDKESIMVQHENEDLFYVYPEFYKNEYEINLICMVFQDLTLSKTTKLKEIYKSNEVAEFIDEAGSSLWFLDDSRLVMSSIEKSRYSEFAILKSKLLLDIYINVQNARKPKDKLEGLLAELESITAN